MPLQYTRSKPSSTQEGVAGDTPAISNESLRQKAKFRLIGSIVLVLLGVLGFTLMLDTQPRPNTSEVTVVIPARDKLPPLAMTTPSTSTASGALPMVVPASAPVSNSNSNPASQGHSTVAASSSLEPQEVIISKPAQAKPAASASLVAPKTEPKAAVVVKKAESVTSTAPTPATSADADKGRYILQVGAFADVQKAREARMKLEHAGIKTYTQVIESSEGKRIRVRVGPFEKRAEAEKLAAKIKLLDLPAALLTL